jgi:tRNA pseudouridine55 synthase
MAPSGVLLYPKPAGVTSHDVVATVRHELRRRTGEKQRVGHAGTLDPFATGLLLVLVGAGTRMQRFLMALPKTYRTVAHLGWSSDTGDVDGALEHTGRVPDALVLPTGDLMQRPPAYSAVKVGGERLYKKARRGEEVDVPPRPVTVYRFEELWRDGDRAGLEVECSAGTYIRQLVADLGDAYCESLERTAIGDFRLDDADPENLIPLEDALSFLPEQALDAEEARRVSHGMPANRQLPAPCPLPTANCQPTGQPVRLTHAGKLIAIAEPHGDELQPTVVIPS